MYEICNVIWGIPYTEEIQKAAMELYDVTEEEFDPTNLEDYGFEFEYSGWADFRCLFV